MKFYKAIKTDKRLWIVYLAGFLMATHFALISYINSSFVSQFVSINVLNSFYVIGSLLSVILLFLAPFLMRWYGNINSFLFFIAIEIIAVLSMGFFVSVWLIIFFLIVQLSLASVLYFWLDLCLEQETKMENTTGNKRGGLLTFSNVAWVGSPLILTLLVNQNNFSQVYILAGLVLIILLPIIGLFFENIKRLGTVETNTLSGFKMIWQEKDQLRIAMVQFILNFFYSWMVIYLPLLLYKEMGFSWDKIGFILTIMLLPFLLFQWPAGLLADKKIGEREILITGFIVISIATFFIPTISAPVFWIWASTLFMTRIGASLIEVASESYFFKHVKEKDVGEISVFRMIRSFSYVLAPLVAIPVIYLTSYSSSFLFLSFFTLSGLFFIPKKDTR